LYREMKEDWVSAPAKADPARNTCLRIPGRKKHGG
jgi:hypothetical protein